MAITVTKLKDEFKQKNILGLYLFYGEEKYIRDLYLKHLKGMVVSDFADFNYDYFEGDNADFNSFLSSVESYPQMSEKKLIVAKNTPFLKSSEYQKSILNILKSIPDTSVAVFIEDDISKIKKDIISAIEERGRAVDFKKQLQSDLRSWVNRRFANSGKKMKIDDMEYLVELCGNSLGKIEIECDKLIAFAGDNDIITVEDINKMVQKPVEYKIFEMVDKLLTKDTDGAYNLLKEFKNSKEQPTVIIGIIYSQLSQLYMFKKLIPEKVNPADYLPANRRFLARKLEASQRKYDAKTLRDLLKQCAKYDIDIKTGKIESYTALEVLMAGMLTKL